MHPRVSIIIPAYNAEGFIRQALSSALAQTERSFEIIVIDDASTDGTVHAVREFDDPRIRLLAHAENHGPSYARNRALAVARGEWIALLDADDWYADERLERLLKVAEEYRADLVADDMEFIAENNKRPFPTVRALYQSLGMEWEATRSIDLLEYLRIDCGFLHPLLRRAFLEQRRVRYFEEAHFGEDFLLYFQCLRAGAVWIAVPECYYYYRRHPASLTNQRTSYPSYDMIYFARLLRTKPVRRDRTLARALRHFLRRRNEQMVRWIVLKQLEEGKWRQAFSDLASTTGLWAPACRLLLDYCHRRTRGLLAREADVSSSR